MRKLITLFVLLLSTLGAVSAQSAQEWLTKLNTSLGERYAMNISVKVGEEAPLTGFFMVEGDAYYITLGIMEVYSDGKLRYEINNERKEVVEDRVNLEACDLLSNPTRAFSFVPNEFMAEVVSNTNNVVLKLTPKYEIGIDAITLTLERNGAKVMPLDVNYDYAGDAVAIALSAADISDTKLPRWDKSAYRAYDIVSFL